MTLQELSTAQMYGLPVKVIILNNGYLGMVRQWQELFYDSRYSGTSFEPFQPDFVKIAGAYGMPGRSVDRLEDLEEALLATLNFDGPALINVNVDPIAKVFPMVPQGTGPGRRDRQGVADGRPAAVEHGRTLHDQRRPDVPTPRGGRGLVGGRPIPGELVDLGDPHAAGQGLDVEVHLFFEVHRHPRREHDLELAVRASGDSCSTR